MKYIIVDDEPFARKGIELLANEINYLSKSGEFNNLTSALEFLENNEVDLMFLDIQMPVITGRDYLKLNIPKPMIIITTAYPDYALEGFEYDVIDYLVKPIRLARFYKAVIKCKNLYNLENNKSNVNDSMIYLRAERRLIKINLKKIIYIEAMKDYSILHTASNTFTAPINLKNFEAQLNNALFVRINKSIIINSEYIDFIEGDLLKVNKIEFSIGNKYKNNLEELLNRSMIIKRNY